MKTVDDHVLIPKKDVMSFSVSQLQRTPWAQRLRRTQMAPVPTAADVQAVVAAKNRRQRRQQKMIVSA